MIKKAGLSILISIILGVPSFPVEIAASFATPWVSREEIWMAHGVTVTLFDGLSVYNAGLYRRGPTARFPTFYGCTAILANPAPFSLSAAFITFDLPSPGPDLVFTNDSGFMAATSVGYSFQIGSLIVTPAIAPAYLPALSAVIEGHSIGFLPSPGLGGTLSVQYGRLNAVVGAHAYNGDIRFDGVPVGSLDAGSFFASAFFPAFGLGYAHFGGSGSIRAYALITDSLGVSEEMDANVDVDALFLWFTRRFGKGRFSASVSAIGGVLWSSDTRLENNLNSNGDRTPITIQADFDPEILYAGRITAHYRPYPFMEFSLSRLFANALSEGAITYGDGASGAGGTQSASSNESDRDPLTLFFAGLALSASIYR